MLYTVIDNKTGKSLSLTKRYATLLVKAKRAHWPEAEPATAKAEEFEEIDGEEAPKKRGRKPKTQE